MDRSFLDVVANDRILLIRETKTVDRSIRPAVKDSNGHPNDSRQHVADLIILTESRGTTDSVVEFVFNAYHT